MSVPIKQMKWCVMGFLLLILCAGVQLNAQVSKVDPVKKFAEVKTKAEAGDATSQYTIAVYYEQGFGVPTNSVEAVKWYLKAASQGNADAQYNLARCYANGQGVAKDEVESANWLRKAADQDFAPAQYNMGVCYRDGQGVATNYVEAGKWVQKAAEQNLPEAQEMLGSMYALGTGFTRNYGEAVKWYRKAADQGNPMAQFKLGFSYAIGSGVTKNYSEAAVWLRKAADQNVAAAQFELGACYEKGIGVETNIMEEMKWYRKAAEQGMASAQYNLGLMYYNGHSMTRDYAEAVKWLHKAADQGLADAQNNLGVVYEYGEGVPRNYIEAYKWYSLAAAQDCELAQKNLSTIEVRMTPEQVAEAQRLAAAFVPRQELPNSSSANSISPTNPSFSGTGFFITEDGYLISNYHVVKAATKVRLLTGAGLIDAKVVQVDAANDLALLKADGKFSPLPISSSRSAQLGGTVATVGFPDIGLQGFAPKLANGEIASLSGAGDDPRYFQISVPVQPGNSGGALVDERGNVIGIVSAKLDAGAALAASGALPENVNYAVKSSLLLSFLESVPAVSAKLKAPNTKDEKFEDVVKSAQDAAVLVLVY